MNDRLGSAEWADNRLVAESYAYRPGAFWLGRSLTTEEVPLGYADDRHICLVSGTRAGKGTTTIINNLCLWPGSVVVIDPKGENASVTAARRGAGSKYCTGMNQRVVVLDPFNVVSGEVAPSLRGRFNPLDVLDPQNVETIDGAGRIADALVVSSKDAKDPFWDESARALVKGLLLHVVTSPEYNGRRTLVTVRELITRGDWKTHARMQLADDPPIENIPPPQGILWTKISSNEEFGGVIAGTGDTFLNMLKNSPKQFESVLQVANRNTEFIDSPGMRYCLEASDFRLEELKTEERGFSLFLSLPQRFMNTHYRWLRMMIALIVNQMEITRLTKGHKDRRKARGTDYPLLMVLDEFAGLKRMEIVENAIAQIAGFGVKLFVVLQSLEQLKGTYKDNWETFLANSGIKMFFGVEDHFTRDYVSKLVGETETIRVMQSSNEGTSESTSETIGSAENWSTGRNQGTSDSEGTNRGTSGGGSEAVGQSKGGSEGTSNTQGTGVSSTLNYERRKILFGLLGEKRVQLPQESDSTSSNQSTSTSQGTNWSDSLTRTKQWGWTQGTTFQTSRSQGVSTSQGGSSNRSTGKTKGLTTSKGRSETVHKRPLINPDEIGRLFSRIDDEQRPIYPGLGLVLITGTLPTIVRRCLYFQDPLFLSKFDAHPDHGFLPPSEAIVYGLVEGRNPWALYYKQARTEALSIAEWLVKPGDLVTRNQPVAWIHSSANYNPAALVSPFAGVIHSIDTPNIGLLPPPGDTITIPVFSIHYYDFEHRRQTAIGPYDPLISDIDALHRSRMTKIFWLALLPVVTAAELLAFFVIQDNIGEISKSMDTWPHLLVTFVLYAFGLLAIAWPYCAGISGLMILGIVWLLQKEKLYPRGRQRWQMWAVNDQP